MNKRNICQELFHLLFRPVTIAPLAALISGFILFLALCPLRTSAMGLFSSLKPEQATQNPGLSGEELDSRVRSFLERHRYSWRDMNVSEADGKVLYDLIIKNNYTRALEIGTSTGHSAIWIAWALSKTGGKLITIEINEWRYRQALKNFEEAGLSPYIEAILGDAHEIVPKLPGPFDFVFCDADKEWYKNYLIAVLPKLVVGGCFTAHNVEGYRMWGIREFLDYLRSLPYMETTIVRPSWTGISISYKRAEK